VPEWYKEIRKGDNVIIDEHIGKRVIAYANNALLYEQDEEKRLKRQAEEQRIMEQQEKQCKEREEQERKQRAEALKNYQNNNFK
jgi:hypothetical protein